MNPSAVLRSGVGAILALASAGAFGQATTDATDLFAGIEPIAHLRTYFWDSQTTEAARSEAWALGGWAGAKTRWYGDVLQLGILGYTSQKLYGPADRGGSELLASGQDPINVLGQAYASLRFAGQTFTGYRQALDQPWVNGYDTRMIPNLFEGYLLSGTVTGVDYIAGYVTKFKPRDSDAFEWMSSAAGSKGPQQGMVLLGAKLEGADGAFARLAEQYLIDTYNTVYVDGAYPFALGAADRLRLQAQYAAQQSVGSAGLGDFRTWMVGLGTVYEHGPATLRAAWTQTGRGDETKNPFGENPSLLHMMQVDFNDANERAWLVGATLDLQPLGAPGLKLAALYGNGHGATNPTTGAPLGSRNETDVKLAYAFEPASPLRGLSFGIEGSVLNQAGAAAQGWQVRVYANYEIAFGHE